MLPYFAFMKAFHIRLTCVFVANTVAKTCLDVLYYRRINLLVLISFEYFCLVGNRKYYMFRIPVEQVVNIIFAQFLL